MQNKTTEFSFVLKPSKHGIGVFSVHDIKKDTYLRLFGDEIALGDRSVVRNRADVPELFRQYCIDRGDSLSCPKDFGCLEVGWYLNHSRTPNAYRDDNYNWYALRDILAGEEVVIDYNTLEEPEGTKEDYY